MEQKIWKAVTISGRDYYRISDGTLRLMSAYDSKRHGFGNNRNDMIAESKPKPVYRWGRRERP